MFAKMPEGYNNPNSPDFPGLNRVGSINNNNSQSNQNENPYPEFPENPNINKVSQNVGNSWLDKINCNISILQVYFDVETDDVIKRLTSSLIPCNAKFITLVEKKPDLYGPFWIYTTLVLIVACAGSLTKFFQGAQNEDYFQKFVPLAASVIYGIGFCLPVIVKVLMMLFGSETSFALVLCIYAYSFSIYAPMLILCIPFEKLQWLLLFYSVASSTCFLLLNFWAELSKYVDNRKYFILGVIGIFQVSLLFILKFQFFAKISSIE